MTTPSFRGLLAQASLPPPGGADDGVSRRLVVGPAARRRGGGPPLYRGLLAGVARDVRGHGRDLLVAELILERRHAAAAVLDLMLDRVLRRLELVEVRADVPGRVSGGEGVAGGAVL